MNLRNLFFLIVSLAVLFGTTGCQKVPAGYAGVKVYLLGGDKGVDHEELGVGRYWIGMNEDLFLFPLFTQNYPWTKDPQEGSENDESITFQTKEGLEVNADIGISYHINPQKVSDVFVKYRRGIDEITDTFLRNMVRDAFVQEASILPVESVYGEGKAKLIDDVQDSIAEQVKPIGIEVEKIYYIGSLRLPPTVVQSLNAKIQATQKAQQRQNEVAEATADANKVREKAKGDADAITYKAKAEANRINVLGEALRKNPEVVKLNMIDKWNGVLPNVLSGAGDGSIPSMLLQQKAK